MSKFETGITSYIHASAKVEVFFPVDSRGNAQVCCRQCYYFNNTTNRCRLNGEVCQYPDKFVGGSCPLDVDTEENE